MAKAEIIETEGFHNQTLTQGARQRRQQQVPKKAQKKVVALQLDEVEHAAFRYLGGVDALKALLCPPNRCICCREADRAPGTWRDSLCADCQAKQGET